MLLCSFFLLTLRGSCFKGQGNLLPLHFILDNIYTVCFIDQITSEFSAKRHKKQQVFQVLLRKDITEFCKCRIVSAKHDLLKLIKQQIVRT